jgi:hypothetical protein
VQSAQGLNFFFLGSRVGRKRRRNQDNRQHTGTRGLEVKHTHVSFTMQIGPCTSKYTEGVSLSSHLLVPLGPVPVFDDG